MGRSYITQQRMPVSFWWWAVRHACQMCIYLPVSAFGNLTTPFELVYCKQPDLRVPFNLFSTGYFYHSVSGRKLHHGLEAMALAGIAVGRDSSSNAMLFYNPAIKQLYSSADYVLDESNDTGNPWQLTYDGGLFLGLHRHGRHPASSTALHVSASTLTLPTPPSLPQALKPDHPDRPIWLASYKEEYDGLRSESTFSILSKAEFASMRHKSGPPIPTMCVLTTKLSNGVPSRAKSRIVVLGNRDPTPWASSDCYAPVISHVHLRLIISLAVAHRRPLKQGDVKNAFCQATLPPTECIVVSPPPGCPFSQPGELWLLRKSLYGLRRAPRHWHVKMSSTLSNIGVLPCPHAPCLYSGRPIAGEPPLYLALYVDDFVYFSASDSVERAFEYKLTQSLKVDFFGCATWFLSISFAWDTSDLPLHLSVHLNQSAFILHLLQIHDMMDCIPASSPFRSGLPIDRVPSSELTPAQQAHLNSVLQSFNGSFIWLSTCTRPDLSVITSQLCAYNHKASAGLLDAARYVLRYLKGSPHHGISFSSRHPTPLHTFINLPPNLTPSSEPSHHLITFSDANWGPQDASNPDPSLPVLLPVSDTRSLSGYVSIRSGGPVQWGSLNSVVRRGALRNPK